jgi:FAD/FMN-containing dehydrogenase
VRPRGAGYLTSLSFNHVTHRARRARPDLAHLQLSGPAVADLPADARAAFDEPLVHLDGFRVAGWDGDYGGLLLARFTDADAWYAGVDALTEAGVTVTDPHTWMLTHNLPAVRAAAARFDPDGLLNPGKLGPA